MRVLILSNSDIPKGILDVIKEALGDNFTVIHTIDDLWGAAKRSDPVNPAYYWAAMQETMAQIVIYVSDGKNNRKLMALAQLASAEGKIGKPRLPLVLIAQDKSKRDNILWKHTKMGERAIVWKVKGASQKLRAALSKLKVGS